MNTLLIGSDSFIAKKILTISDNDLNKGISRIPVINSNETFIPNFFEIPEKTFNGFDSVINFAAIVHKPEIKDEQIYNEINYKLALLNAQKAKNAGVKLFIQMSTIAVYGSASLISNGTIPNPLDAYGRSKLKADEELLKLQDKNFKVAIIRSPMVYGGGNAPGNMMRLIQLTDKKIPLPFKGIENKRDFINVNNLVQFLSLIIQKRMSGIYLLSDDEPISTENAIRTISKYLNKKPFLIRLPNFTLKMIKTIRPKEYRKLFGTLQLTHCLPFENNMIKYSFKEGIKEMVEWYKSNKK